MFIRQYFQPLLKWWWLLVVSAVIAGVTSYLVLRDQPPVYQARTTLMIGRVIVDPNPTSNEFYLGQQLARVYADFALRGPIVSATTAALDLDELPEYEARPIPNSQLLEISVTDTNSGRAAAVANELAQQLILLTPTGQVDPDDDRQLFIRDQLDYLQTKVEETLDEIFKKQAELAELVSAREIENTQETIAALQAKLNDLQSNYAALLMTTQDQASNIISVIEPAYEPVTPVGPSVPLLIALAIGISLVLAATGAYLIEFLDDTIKNRDDVKRVLGLPILASIPQTKRLVPEGENGILFLEEPNSLEADTFRVLQTNLRFAWGENTPKSILITSLGPGDGKTTIAVNLAAAFANSKKQVLLVDADLRRSTVHRFAGIQNEVGLSDVFNGDLDPAGIVHPVEDSGLNILTSGRLMMNPMDFLDSSKLSKVLTSLEKEADLVIFDAPPLPLPETLVLASKLDGVIIVLRSGQIKEATATAIMEQLKRAQANLLGVVLNRVPPGSSYNKIISLYGYKEIPHKQEIAKDAVQEEPSDLAESESGTKTRFRKKTQVMEHSKRAQANLLGAFLNRVHPGSVYKNVISLYDQKKIPHEQEIAEDAVQEEPGDPAESKSGKKTRDHKKTNSLAPAIFLDRDGVIIENRPNYVRSWNDVFIYPQVLDALARVSLSDFKIVIVTNQSVVGRGLITNKQAEKINQQLVKVIENAGGRVDGVFMCPHHPDQECPCRKPKPELILRAAESLSLDLSASIMIGDALSDLEAGKAAGVPKLVLVQTGLGADQSSLGNIHDLGEEAMVCDTLADALYSFVESHDHEGNE